MIKTNTANWTAIAAALLFFAACGKKEESAPTPVLSPPKAIEKVPAQAEVKASSGPVELTFLLRETRVKLGESLWEQLRIRNISDKKIFVIDQAFHDPRQLARNSLSRFGIYLEMVAPNGKPMTVEVSRPPYAPNDMMPGVSGLLEVEGPQEQAMLDAWKKQGLSDREIDNKLIDFNMKKRRDAAKPEQWSGIELLPGQSVETKYAFYYSMQDKIHNRASPRPNGDFARLDFFVFDYPGIYKVRAVYDRAPTKNSLKIDLEFKHGPDPEEVLVRTPWVSITVLP